MSQDPYRTFHANQALELSELVNLRFARLRYGTTDPRKVCMREPDGPSTDAGRKARQPLVLESEGDESSGLVFGFVDLFKHTADIRGHALLKKQYEQRFGRAFSLSNSEYGRLVDELKTFLKAHSIDVRLINSTRNPALSSGAVPAVSRSPMPAAAPRTSIAVWPMLLSAAIGFAVCYVLFELELLPL